MSDILVATLGKPSIAELRSDTVKKPNADQAGRNDIAERAGRSNDSTYRKPQRSDSRTNGNTLVGVVN
jgi:hypothetical protein